MCSGWRCSTLPVQYLEFKSRYVMMSRAGILLVFFIFLMGCEKNYNPLKDLPKDKTFRFTVPTEPPTLDWNKATDTTSSMVIDNIMEGLVEYDFSQKGKVLYKPALAQSVKYKNKGQTWIFTLREGVYWTDGVPLTAQHVVDGWERLFNPKTASAYAYFLYSIKNSREYNKGEIRDFSKVGVKITSDQVIEVELTSPRMFFPFLLTHTSSYPIRKDVIEKHGAKWTEPENIVTLGAYTLNHWEHDKLLILKRNSSYYGAFPGNAKNVSVRVIPEVSTALNLFDAGQLDFLDNIPSKQLSALKKRPEYFEFPSATIQYYGINTTRVPLNNPKVRKALAMAIDKTQIEKLFRGKSKATRSWIPSGIFGYNSDIGLSFNPEKARKLLDSAGGVDSLPTMTITFNPNEDHQRMAENIQAQWKTNLSLNVEVRNEEWKVYLDNLKNIKNIIDKPGQGKIFIYRMGWVPDYPDPNTYMDLMTSYSDNNYSGWGSEQFDKLVESAASLENGPEKQKLYDQAQRILLEEGAPVIPLVTGKQIFLASPRIKKYPYNTMVKRIFKEIVLQ